MRLSARHADGRGLAGAADVAREVALLTGVAITAADVVDVVVQEWTDAVAPASAAASASAAADRGIHVTGAAVAGTGLASVIPHARALAARRAARIRFRMPPGRRFRKKDRMTDSTPLGYTLFAVLGHRPRAEAPDAAALAELTGVVDGLASTGVTLRGLYDVTGMRAEADLMVWLHTTGAPDGVEDPAVLQKALRALRRSTALAEFDNVWSAMGVHREAEFNKRHVPGYLRGEHAAAGCACTRSSAATSGPCSRMTSARNARAARPQGRPVHRGRREHRVDLRPQRLRVAAAARATTRSTSST